MYIKIILALGGLVGVFIIAVRLIVNNMTRNGKTVYILGLVTMIAFVVHMIVQAICLSGLVDLHELNHAMGSSVDILMLGYILLITFYNSKRNWADYMIAVKLKLVRGGH